MSLKGKVALVTGSTSGIGLGIAQTLAKEGVTVIANGFGDHEAAVAAIRKAGAPKVGYHSADLSKVAEIEAMIAYAEKEFGGVDVLVNNAGIQFVSPVEHFPAERWDAVIAINLSSAFHTIRLTLDGMKKKKWGRIINIASAHGLVASAQKTAYVAAKHGIVGLTKAVALETAQTPVTCNAICPGWVLTPLVQKQIEAKAKESNITVEQASWNLVIEKQPSGVFVTPRQIGGLALFLCGSAADQVRGAAWNMDGGWVAQ